MLHTDGGRNKRPPIKKVFRAKRAVFLSIVLLILTTSYTFASQINSNNLVPTQEKQYIEVTVGLEHTTLWGIASWANREYKLGYGNLHDLVSEIEQENGVTPVIQVGQKLRVPVEVE